MKSIIEVASNRDKGYINIDKILGLPPITSFEELLENLKNNKEVNIIKIINNSNRGIQLVLSFKYNEVEYFYKYERPREPFKVSPYNELIACEIAEDLFLPHVDYDLAIIGGFKGVISKDFRKNNVKYLSGKEFLSNNYPLGHQDNISNLNNLEDIWIALEKYYNGNQNYQNIVSELMKKIVNIFIFDLLTGQTDRHFLNWGFIEYLDGTLDLQPLFDNMRILVLHHREAEERYPSVSRLLLQIDQDVGRYFEDSLEEFLKFSGKEFVNSLYHNLWVISQENLQKIFTRIEKKSGYPMSEELKQFYLKEFNVQLNFLTETYDRVTSSRHKL